MEYNYLGISGTQKLVENIDKKLDKSKLYPLNLDEYNTLFEKGMIEDDTYYFIIDKDDEIFDKIEELQDTIEQLRNELQDVQDFKNRFPIDNRTYGIINQQPKNLSEVFPDELGIPTDKNDQESSEEPEVEEQS